MKIKNKWLMVVGGLVAAAAALFIIKQAKGGDQDKPPKRAPQLDIQNPGSQDDFPTSPMESEVG